MSNVLLQQYPQQQPNFQPPQVPINPQPAPQPQTPQPTPPPQAAAVPEAAQAAPTTAQMLQRRAIADALASRQAASAPVADIGGGISAAGTSVAEGLKRRAGVY